MEISFQLSKSKYTRSVFLVWIVVENDDFACNRRIINELFGLAMKSMGQPQVKPYRRGAGKLDDIPEPGLFQRFSLVKRKFRKLGRACRNIKLRKVYDHHYFNLIHSFMRAESCQLCAMRRMLFFVKIVQS